MRRVERLASLQLPAAAPAWVPDQAERADDPLEVPADPPTTPIAGVSPADLARGWAKDRAPVWLHGVLDRATVGSVVSTVAAVVAVIVALVMVVHRHEAPSDSASYPSSTSNLVGGASGSGSYQEPSADPVTSSAASIVVDVGGRVRRPGLVTLPAGARVADAVDAAGGPLRHRELAATNLAARVTDGQLLLIGTKPTVAPTAAGADSGTSSASPVAPIDLNSATLEDLETLPGIGPVTGQKIIDWRTAHSGFTSIEQLQQVSGIGPATYAELSPLVTP